MRFHSSVEEPDETDERGLGGRVFGEGVGILEVRPMGEHGEDGQDGLVFGFFVRRFTLQTP